jgi:hypothetical protein
MMSSMKRCERREELIISTMENLFSPCTRLFDLLENRRSLEDFTGHNIELFQELNLDVSTEEFLSAERAFSYADLYGMLGNINTVAWLTPHAFVVRKGGNELHAGNHLDESYRFSFSVDGKDTVACLALSPQHLLEISDVVLRLLAVSVVQSVRLTDWTYDLFINARTLAYLMEQCQSLRVLTLKGPRMDENHCRVLGDYSRPDLEIVLDYCKITNAGAGALAEVLGRNHGPTKLDLCCVDNFVLANGLRGNSRLKSLTTRLSHNVEVCNREVLEIACALKENRGLVDLNLLSGRNVTDQTWDAVCDSLKAHPTLEVLDLLSRGVPIKSRVKALVDMMKVNMSIHTIHLDSHYTHHELYRELVIPYLETNRFRPHLLAIQKTRPIPYRAKVVGKALLSACTDPNRFWMLLSGNSEVDFPSTTAAASPYSCF